MASLNPANIIGLSQGKGKINKGFDADLVVFDQDFKCQATIVQGRIIFNKLD